MASKKFYGVRKGKITGVFESWQVCREAVEGYPGAEYKGFSTLEEARAYLGEKGAGPAGGRELPDTGNLLAYVDGSYDDSLKKYAFGCVFILPDGRVFTEYGNGDKEQSLQHRNVTGEMLGAMYAVKFAMLNGFSGIEIRYDYQGIEKWVTGEWRTRTLLTSKYAAAMREWAGQISIRFTKVEAHANVYYNELADKMAKTGLREADGIPKVRRAEDMEEYHGTDEAE